MSTEEAINERTEIAPHHEPFGGTLPSSSALQSVSQKRIISRKKDTRTIEIDIGHFHFVLGNFFRNRRNKFVLGVFAVLLVLSFVLTFQGRADITKADLYSSTCLGSWQNPTQAEGIPDVAEGAAYFTRDNSAYTSDENSQIYCGEFKGDTPSDALPKKFTLKLSWLVTANATGPASASGSEQNNSSDVTPAAPELPASGDANSEDTSVPPLPSADENNSSDSTVTSPPSSSDSTATPAPSSDGEQQTESSTPPSAPDAVPDAGTNTPAEDVPPPAPAPTPDSGPTSFLQTIIPIAHAQETPTNVSTDDTVTSTDVPTDTQTDAADVSSDTNTNDTQVVTVPADDLLEVLYTVDGTNWKSLGKVNAENWKNTSFDIDDTDVKTWEDLSKLQISVRTLMTAGTPPVVYLDSAYIEVVYETMVIPQPLPSAPTVSLNDSANIDIMSGDADFNTNDTPTFIVSDPKLSEDDIKQLVKDGKANIVSDPYGKLGDAPLNTATNEVPTPDLTSPLSLPPLLQVIPTPSPEETPTGDSGQPPPSSSELSPSTPAILDSIQSTVDSISNSAFTAPPVHPSIDTTAPAAEEQTSMPTSPAPTDTPPLPATPSVSFFKNIFQTHTALAESDSDSSDTPTPATSAHVSDVTVLDPKGNSIDIDVTLATVTVDGVEHQEVKINKPDRVFQPGLYKLKITLATEAASIVSEQDFTWGVLAVNFNKTVYQKGDAAYIQMGVLTDLGHTICDANLKLAIKDPSGVISVYKTSDGTIVDSADCGADNVTDTPDYYLHKTLNQTGTYQILLMNLDNGRQVKDSISVTDAESYSIERVGATRINPFKSTYVMTLKVKSGDDFNGTITETVPGNFDITDAHGGEISDSSSGSKTITWPIVLSAGVKQTITYEYQAPQVSPDIFILGKAALLDTSSNPVFTEVRQWQLASDATCNATTTGSWNTGTNWTGCAGALGVPGIGDNITIDAGKTITMNVNSPVLGTITVNGTLWTSDGTARSLSGTSITIGASGKLASTTSAGAAAASAITLSGTTGTLLTMTAGGIFTASTSTLSITGSGSNTINNAGWTGTNALNNVTENITGVTKTLGADLDINGLLTITLGTFDTSSGSSYTLNVGKISMASSVSAIFNANASAINITGTTSSLFTKGANGAFNAGTSTVNLTGNGTATFIATAAPTFYDLTSSGTGTKTLGISATVSHVFSVTNGTFTIGTQTLTLSGTTGTPFATPTGGGIFDGGTGIVAYTGNNTGGNTTIESLATYYSLTINNSSETFVPNGDLLGNVAGTLTITNGTLDTTTSGCSGASCNITIGKISLANTVGVALTANSSTINLSATSGTLFTRAGANGVFNAGTSTVNLTGNGSATVVGTTSPNFYNLTSSATGTKTLGVAGTISGELAISNGTFAITSLVLTLSGTDGTPLIISGSGALTATTGTVTYTGDNSGGNTTIASAAGYYNLTLNNSTETYVPDGDITGNVAGTLTITNGTLDTTTAGCGGGTRSCNITYGKISIANASTAILEANSSVITFNATTSTLITRGANGVFHQDTSEVYISPASGTGITLLSGTITFHKLTIDTAAAVINTGAAITMSSANAANKLYIKTGVLNATTTITGTANGTFVMDSGTTFCLGGATSGTTATCNSAATQTTAVAFPANYTNGNITLNSTSTVSYLNNATTTVSSTPTYSNLNVVPILSAARAYTFASGTTTVAGDFAVKPITGAFLLTVNMGASNLSGAISVAGTTTLDGSTSTSKLITHISSTDYNLTTGFLNVTAQGTLDATSSSATITLAGTTGTLFTLGGTFNAGTSTVALTGNGNAVVNSAAMTFYNLSASGTGTKSLGTTIAVKNLSVTAGTFADNGYQITLDTITPLFSYAFGFDVDSTTGGTGFEICPSTDTCKIGLSGSGNGQFNNPYGVAVDSSGNVYVTDPTNSRIEKFDSSGNYVTKWGSSGAGKGQFNNPFGVAVDSSSNVYVVESSNNRIQKFDSSGTFLYAFGFDVDSTTGGTGFEICPSTDTCKSGLSGSGNGQFSTPYGVAVDSSGNVYVTDTGNNRIEKFDSSGNYVTKWGSSGAGNGQFSIERGVVVDSSSNVYVVDSGNNRIQKFDSSGTFLYAFGFDVDSTTGGTGFEICPSTDTCKIGLSGSGNGQFNNPYGVAVDSSGNVYVTDPTNSRIEKFDSSGNYVTKWGSSGAGKGQFDTERGIIVDSSGNLYIADSNNNRVVKETSAGALTLASGATLQIGSGASATFLPAFGTFSLDNNSTVVYNSTSSQTIAGVSYGNLQLSTISSTPTKTLDGNTVINGSLTVDASNTLATGSHNITLGGDFTQNGTFTAGTGTLTLGGTTQQTLTGTFTSGSALYALTITNNSGVNPSGGEITGMTPSVNFASALTTTNLFTVNTAHARVEYHTGSTYTFNTINWHGTAGNPVFFRNSATSSAWTLHATTPSAVTYLDVSRSDATGSGTAIDGTDVTNIDSLNNTNWNFPATSGSYSVSGHAYAGDNTFAWIRCDGSTQNVSLVVNGAAAVTTSCDASTGAYSFSSVFLSAGDPVSVFYNTNGFNFDYGDTIDLMGSSPGNTTIDVHYNYVWLQREYGAGSITNAILAHCDSTVTDCGNVPYTVSSGALSVNSGYGIELRLTASATFAPGGDVTADYLHVQGTYTGGSELLTLNGYSSAPPQLPLYMDGGTFTAGSNTVNYTSALGGSVGVDTSVTYNNLEFLPLYSGDTFYLGVGYPAPDLNVKNFIMGDGTQALTVDAGSNDANINVSGNLTLCDGACNTGHYVTYLQNGAETLTFKPTGTKTWTDNDPVPQDMGIVVIGSGSSTPKINLGSDVMVDTVTINASHEMSLNGAHTLTLNSSVFAYLLTNVGTFTPSTGTVAVTNFFGYPYLNTYPISFYNLTLGDNAYMALFGGGITVNNNLTLGINAQFSDGGHQITGNSSGTLTLGANAQLYLGQGGATTFPTGYTNPHISLDVTSTIRYVLDNFTTISHVPTYGNLELDDFSVGTLDGNTVVNGSLSIGGPTLDVSGSNYSLTVGGDITNGGTFLAENGTVSLTSTVNTQTLTGNFTASASSAFYNLTINKSGQSAVLAAAIDVSHDLTVTAGTLDDSGYLITGGSGTLTAGSGATVKIANTTSSAWPTFTTYALNAASTVIYYSNSNQTINGFSSGYGNLRLSRASGTPTKTLAGDIVINGSLTVDASNTLATGSHNITLGGDFTQNGTFTAGTGTLTLGGTTQQTLTGTFTSGSALYALTITNNSGVNPSGGEITGMTPSVNFASALTTTNLFTVNTAHARVEYHTGSTYTFNTINWHGTAGNPVFFRNSATSSAWTLHATTPSAVTYLDVSRSDATGSGTAIDGTDASNTDSNNNTNWTFTSSGLSISGSANGNNGATVKVAVNGTIQAQTTTIAASAWSITGVTTPSSGDIITVFVDGVTDANETTAVTKWTSGNINSMVLNTNVLTIGSNQNNSITNTDLSQYTVTNDEDVMQSVSAGALSVQGTGNTYTNPTLSVLASNTYAPGGNATTGLIAIAGTYTGNTETLTLTGTSGTLFTRTGTFTQGTSEVIVTSASGSPTLLSAATTFHKLTINSAATVINAGAAITMSSANAANKLYVQQGVLNDGGNQITGTSNGTLVVDGGAALCIGGTAASTNATCDSGATPTSATTFPTNYTNGNIFLATASPQVLIVAGGGGGGSSILGSGGGGGGGVIYDSGHSLSAGSYSVTVGGGGSGAGASSSGVNGNNGSDSVFDSLDAVGGGGGQGGYTNATPGGDGGSGGGGAALNGVAGVNGNFGHGTIGQGYDGGTGYGAACYAASGGGGGAGAVGHDATSSVAGNGGDGISNSISGSATYYGGGGGASYFTCGPPGANGSGGLGGGGNGGGVNSGTANTGGGGGASNKNSSNAGNGGSGVVVISYPTGSVSASGGTMTTSGGNTIHTFTSSGTFTVTAVNHTTVYYNANAATTISQVPTYDNVVFRPVLTSGRTYTLGGAMTINGNWDINPSSSGSNLLLVNAGGAVTVASGKTTTLERQGSTATSTLDIRPSSTDYNLSTGFLNIGAGGTLDGTGAASTITLTGTSGTLFANSGTFTQGSTTVNLAAASGTPTVASGSPTFYNLATTGTGTFNLGETLTATNNLSITTGTMATANNTVNVGRIILGGGTFTPGSSALNLTGTSGTLFTYSSGTLTGNTAAVTLSGNGSATVASGMAGYASFYALTSSGTGTKSLGEALTISGALTISAGTFDTSSGGHYVVNAGTLAINGGTFTPQSSTVTLNGTGTVWNYTSGTITPGTSTIKLTDASSSGKTFAGGGQTYNNFWFAPGVGTGSLTITGNNTFNDFKDDGTVAHSLLFTQGSTTTVTTFSVTGHAGQLITINSAGGTGTHTLTKAGGGTITTDYLNVQHSLATPSSTWDAGVNSVNNQGVSTAGNGWAFGAIISVTISSNGTISYGFVAPSNSKDTTASGLNTTPVATNDGTAAEDFNVKGQNTACPWTLASSIGVDQYKHEFSTNGGSSYTPLATGYNPLVTNIASSATQNMDLKITLPSSSACLTSQAVDVTVQAVAH